MAASVAEEAIAILIDLAERGEIDPWDVQVIDVIDRFLSRVSPTTQDLSESGQAFLYAAMLVYLKAMALADPTPDAPASDPDLGEEMPANWPPDQLDRILQPRAMPRLVRTRPITLKDLIRHLQELEELLRPAPKPLTERISRQKAIAAITQLAHPENLVETTAEIEALLAQIWQGGSAQVDFEQLAQRLLQGYSGQDTAPHRIQIFWALLLMASRSQVDLIQTDFYGSLTVQPCRPPAPDPGALA